MKRAERWVILPGIAFVVAVAGSVLLFQGTSGTVSTTSLEVLDAQGNIVALLGQKDGRTGLLLMDEKSTPHVSIFHSVEDRR